MNEADANERTAERVDLQGPALLVCGEQRKTHQVAGDGELLASDAHLRLVLQDGPPELKAAGRLLMWIAEPWRACQD